MFLKKIGSLLTESLTWEDQDYFLKAAKEGDAYKVQQVLAKGVSLETRYSDGFTALMSAVEHGHLGVAEVLLERGARTEAQDYRSRHVLGNQLS